jgi:23S rRNA (guanosine2251-2'-O)-methyltransferase
MRPRQKRQKPERLRGQDRRDSRDEQTPVGPANSVIYGVSPVLEALRAANRRIDRVLIAEGAKEARLDEIFEQCRERSIVWNRVPRDTFSKYLEPETNHQGVLAFVAAASYVDADEMLASASIPQLLLILDGVEDPRNFGAILRVAECSGVDGVLIPERRAVGLTDTVAKSSAGAIELVKVAKTTNLNRSIEKLKTTHIWVIGTSANAAMSYETGPNPRLLCSVARAAGFTVWWQKTAMRW